MLTFALSLPTGFFVPAKFRVHLPADCCDRLTRPMAPGKRMQQGVSFGFYDRLVSRHPAMALETQCEIQRGRAAMIQRREIFLQARTNPGLCVQWNRRSIFEKIKDRSKRRNLISHRSTVRLFVYNPCVCVNHGR